MQGLVCRTPPRQTGLVGRAASAGIAPIGTGVTIAGLAGNPGVADAAFLEIERAICAFAVIACRVILALLARAAALNQTESHPDSPNHGAKSKQFGKRGNHVMPFITMERVMDTPSQPEAGEMGTFDSQINSLVDNRRRRVCGQRSCH